MGMTLPPPVQNRDRKGAALTYLMTWTCYGAWLPGQTGAIPRTRNRFGAPLPESDARTEQQARKRMKHQPYLLDAIRRQAVLKSLEQVCSCRGWTLLAAHVRTNHVHVVAIADRKPEHVMNALKAYSSRYLNQCAPDTEDRRRWARHGSTRYLWTSLAVSAAIQYVVRGQGEAMAVFETPAAR